VDRRPLVALGVPGRFGGSHTAARAGGWFGVRRAADVARALVAGAAPHGVFLALLAAGAALRAVTQLAYHPALLYYDSFGYLDNAAALHPFIVRPLGYPLFLRLLPFDHDLSVIPLAQHVLGLAMAVALYVLLLRLGVRRSLAAAATAPVLLDTYQLNIEEYVLSETLFQALLVAGAAIVLWPTSRISTRRAVVLGLVFAAVAVTRGAGTALMAPLVLTMLVLRSRPAALAAVLVCFAAPVAAYAVWFEQSHPGVYSVTGYGGRFLYARVAPFADCSRFSVPARERVLCPRQPLGHRPSVEFFMWDHDSPVYRLPLGDRTKIAGSFARRVIRHQSRQYARVVLAGSLRGFAPVRSRHARELPINRWQFRTRFPIFRDTTQAVIRQYGGGHGRVRPRLASFLRSYQRFGYAPGPLLALCLIAALGAVLAGRRVPWPGARAGALLFAALGVAAIVSSVAANQFTWRYWLPELVLLPPAGALGATVLARFIADRRARDARGSAALAPAREATPDGAGTR
jgi:hypothetical protein